METLRFLKENARWLLAGALLSYLSSFGQTFFIAIFAGELRAAFGLSHGQWGGIYTVGTGLSALAMVWAGGLADQLRVRALGAIVLTLLAMSCFFMGLNDSAFLLPFVIFALRFTGQGMASHVSAVAMARWFVATRGRALAVATLGFSLAEATMPLTFVWLKTKVDWHVLWIGVGIFTLCMIPLLWALLRTERTPSSEATTNAATGMDSRHWTRTEVLRHPLFWALVPALMFFPAFGTAFWFQQVHFAEIKGWDHLALVAVFPLGTATLVASTILFGMLIDRFGTAPLFPIYLLPLVAAFALHALTDSILGSAIGVMLMGLAGGGQATLPSACWAEYFGTRHLGKIRSAVTAIMVLGSAVGPGLSGWLIDAGVGYESQLLWFATSFAFAAVVTILPLKAATLRLAAAT